MLFWMVVVVLLLIGIHVIYHSRYNGIWEMRGYGLTFKINHGLAKSFEVTDSYYCKENNYNGIIIGKTLISGIGKFKVKRTDDVLELFDAGAQVTYSFTKRESAFFESKVEVKSSMQAEKFGMFYEMFQENYAFQDLYGVNLPEIYDTMQKSVTKETSDQVLFNYMGELVSNLKDGHIAIDWNEESFSPADYIPEWISNAKQLNLLTTLIQNHYVMDYKKFDKCPIRYGLLSEQVGYIVIHGMGVESLNITGSTKKAMDQIINEFNEKGIKKLAMELRFNNGGFDAASLCIAGYFTNKKYLAYKKQAFTKGEYTPLQEVYVNPQSITYDGEVYILTSGFTISAAETFVRGMLANPEHKVTIVGERTAGFYSDAIPRSLPDGFSYSLSNEVYYWYNDEPLEGQGVFPDVMIPVSMEAANEGTENALKWILGN